MEIAAWAIVFIRSKEKQDDAIELVFVYLSLQSIRFCAFWRIALVIFDMFLQLVDTTGKKKRTVNIAKWKYNENNIYSFCFAYIVALVLLRQRRTYANNN